VRQELTADRVECYIDAVPEIVYDIVSDVTRTPDYSPDIVKVTWIGGATGPAVGARFKAINRGGNRPNWWNKPVITTADRGREFAFTRTETFGGTLEWRYTFTPESTGTRVVEAYTVTKEVTPVGWFIIGTLYGRKHVRADLRQGMRASLDKLATIAETTTGSAS
jgi:hypothetical protein